MTVSPHPQFERLFRIMAGLRRRAGGWSGFIYRSTTPEYANARDMLSGAGSRMYWGRWNAPESFAAVYGSLIPEAAMAECLAHHRHHAIPLNRAMPRVFVAVSVRLHRVLDFTDAPTLAAIGFSARSIAREDWRRENDTGDESLTQVLGRAAREARFEGLHVPSARVPNGENLVIFPDRLLSRSRVTIDPPHRS